MRHKPAEERPSVYTSPLNGAALDAAIEKAEADVLRRSRPPRPTNAPGSDAERLAVAARSLPPGTFTLEQLVMAAWEWYPTRFALNDRHPCSATVRAALFGARGALAKGLLAKVRPNVFRVSEVTS